MSSKPEDELKYAVKLLGEIAHANLAFPEIRRGLWDEVRALLEKHEKEDLDELNKLREKAQELRFLLRYAIAAHEEDMAGSPCNCTLCLNGEKTLV